MLGTLQSHLGLLFVAGIAVVLAVVAFYVGGALLARRRAVRVGRHTTLPPLIFSVRHDDERRLDREIRPSTFREPPAPARAAPEIVPESNGSSWTPPGRDRVAEGATVRLRRVGDDEPLQFLPGRLEVERGGALGQEIRFVRAGDGSGDVTLGRADGPPERHVRLDAETISRQHARMQFVNGRWRIVNLSQTNPTIVNGQSLDADVGDVWRWLQDGDRIELGEMVFRFRER